jgi:hypothetical protein
MYGSGHKGDELRKELRSVEWGMWHIQGKREMRRVLMGKHEGKGPTW